MSIGQELFMWLWLGMFTVLAAAPIVIGLQCLGALRDIHEALRSRTSPDGGRHDWPRAP